MAPTFDPKSWQASKRAQRTGSGDSLYFGEFAGEQWVYFRPPHYMPEVQKEWMSGWWDKSEGAYRLPKLRLLVERAQQMVGVSTDQDVQDWLDESAPKADTVFDSPDWYERRSSFARWEDLYPFQRNAVSQLVESDRGQLEVLNPGLGKTVVAIAAAEILGLKRVLVVCPKPLRRNWAREIREWSDGDVEIRDAKDGGPGNSRWTVTNYEAISLKHDVETDQWGRGIAIKGPYADVDWDVIILDETIMLKNRKAKRTKACQALAKCTPKLWMLSGSPVAKGNEDAWAQLNMLRPTWITAFWRFAAEYSIVERGTYGMQILGSRSNREMSKELPEMLFARTMDEVLPDLPDYITKVEEVELTKGQAKAHKQALDGLIEEFEGMGDSKINVPNALTAITRASQVTSNLCNLRTTGHDFKDESAKADWIMAALEGEGEVLELPAVIWTFHKPGAEALYKRLQDKGYNVGLATGDTDAAEQVELFRDEKLDILILSLGVGKYGHNLQRTKTFIYLDRIMDSDAMFQSWWRGRRIGLKHRPVLYILRAPGSIDEFIEDNLAGKMPSLSGVTGQDLAKLLRNIGLDTSGREG